jgi:hypothetical protein
LIPVLVSYSINTALQSVRRHTAGQHVYAT